MNGLVATAPALACWQRAFHDALWAEAGPSSPASTPAAPEAAAAAAALADLVRQPGFRVYRNTVMKGCIDALEANYPAVARLVGRDWFRSAAAVHVRQSPPMDARLMAYGADFPAFLDAFAPAAGLPYLSGVAAIERAWTESHLAADAQPLAADALAAFAPEALGSLRLQPHPAARWRWCGEHPAFTIWQRNRAEGAEPGEGHSTPVANGRGADEDADVADWRGEGTLLTRPGSAVQVALVAAGGCALLDACAAGATLGDAAGAALQAEPGRDLGVLLAQLLLAGAFSALPPGAPSAGETRPSSGG